MGPINPTYEYDPSADALVIKLRPESEIARTVEVNDSRFVDVNADGDVVEIEILWASGGVQVEDLIDRFQLWDFKPFLQEVSAQQFRPRSFA
ncbi:MAG: DUF2283 domain-containing protein [Actinomycetota bacterium]